MSWVYIFSGPPDRLYTVGHYSPDGKWHPDSDWSDQAAARLQCRWLNGGNDLREDDDDNSMPAIAELNAAGLAALNDPDLDERSR